MIPIGVEVYRRFALAAFLIGGGRISYLILFYVLAHVVPPDQFGLFSVSLAICQVAWLITSFGTGPAAQRIIPESLAHGNSQAARDFIKFSIAVSAVGSITFSLIAVCIGSFAGRLAGEEGAQVAFAAAIMAPIITFSALREFLARALESSTLAFLPRDIVWCLSLACFAGAASHAGEHLILTATILLGAIEAVSWTILFNRIKRLPQTVCGPRVPLRIWIDRCCAMMMANIGTLAFERVDVIAVGLFTNLTTAGVYGVTSRIAPLLSAAQRFIIPVISPVIARAVTTGQRALLWREVRLGIVASVPVATFGLVLIWGAANPILELFGPRFLEGAWILRTLAVGHLFIALGSNFGVVILMGRQPWIHVAAVWSSLIPTVIALIYTTAHFGSIGAALTITAGIVIYNVLVITGSVIIPPTKNAKEDRN